MSYADDHGHPPPAPRGWPQSRPQSQPYGYAPRQESYGRDPWQESYGHDAPRSDAYRYDASPYGPFDAYPSYDPFGQAPRREPQAYETERQSAELVALRSAYRVLRRVSTLTALGSFVIYVVLSCSAPDLMGAEVAGELSLGMALGIIQLLVTFAAVLWYGRSAQRSVDPLARLVRERAARPGRDAGVAR
ncbi:DUF485 domain-containing protein [Streptomyces sp. NPDC005209]|uniref:DUF485 domain-containing protein n=1 Tax=Streptomyces sp. NPDC005209 TaxID=3156715 RepID=UPI0033BB8AA9